MEDTRYAAWLDLVAELVRQPAGTFPRADVADQLYATFGCQLSWNWMDPDGMFGMEIHTPAPGFPSPEEADLWVGGAMTRHPLVYWYEASGDPTPMSVSRVPRDVVPREGFGMLRELLGPRGWHQQLSIPYSLEHGRHRAFVLAREDDFDDAEVELARRLQPLLALLARQAEVLGRRPPPGDRAGLTSRELAVLALLGEGLSAAAIAERLFISPRTVHSHVGSIYRKLRAPDRLRAVLVAQDLGLMAPPTASPSPDHCQPGLPQRWASPRPLPFPRPPGSGAARDVAG